MKLLQKFDTTFLDTVYIYMLMLLFVHHLFENSFINSVALYPSFSFICIFILASMNRLSFH